MNDLYIVANFGEIFLKGKNISFFEKRLLKNLKENLGDFLKNVIFEKVAGGSFYIKLNNNLKEKDILDIENIVKNTPGFISFFRAYFVESDLEKIKEKAAELTEKEIENNNNIRTFAVSSERSEKEASLGSKESNIKVGSAIWETFEKNGVDISVNLDNPDLKFYIKIKKDLAFIYTKKERAVGGLPVGSTGKAIVFFSGGIDSPVACFLAQKRGLEVVAVHFHSFPQTTKKSIEKVKNLVKTLTKFQANIKLYLIPIIPVQKNIVESAKRSLSIVLQRRAFMKIGQIVADKEKITAFITGDSLGQVASQTLENLITVSEASENIILRPLIGLDKTEIIEIAERIGTLKISQLPHEDACSLFTPKKPETRSKLIFTKEEEEKLNKSLLKEAFQEGEIINIKNDN